jgi:TrmH family RNA methyltransferase
VKTISSRQHPFVRACRVMAASPDPTGARLLLDGLHLVRDARAAGCRFEAIAVTPEYLAGDPGTAQLVRECESDGATVFVVGAPVIAAMSPVRSPSGLVAIAHRRPTDLAAVLRQREVLVVVAANVQDPGNLGAILRAAEAGGVTAAVVAGASAHPWSWKTVRGSMGSALRLPVGVVPDISEAFSIVRAAGLRTVAAIPRGGREPDAVDWTGRIALVIGGEGPGLDETVVAEADDRVSVPMAAPVESLNVAVAAALLVYAARRQRIGAAPVAAAREGSAT